MRANFFLLPLQDSDEEGGGGAAEAVTSQPQPENKTVFAMPPPTSAPTEVSSLNTGDKTTYTPGSACSSPPVTKY